MTAELAEQLPWLTPSVTRLESLFSAQRLPHAILLAGPPGWGQAQLADWLARRLLGLSDAEPGPMSEVAHADLRWTVPDGAMIKVDQVRALAQFAVGTRQLAQHKVAVLDRAHCLNESAANGLLKTLEEPPPQTVLVLVTEYASRLLPTIRSRCQRFDVRPDAALGQQWLEQTFGDDSAALAFEYGGAPLAVAAALEREERSLAGALAGALAGQWSALHAELVQADVATVLLRWLRYVVAELSGSGRLTGLQSSTPRALLAFQAELVAAQGQFVSSNSVNHRLQLERLALRFAQLAAPVA
ncbi:MAG: AAA family ATPase [Pseudomonadales bacterium]